MAPGAPCPPRLRPALAQGLPLPEAVDQAVDFVARAIETAPELGQGQRPGESLCRNRVLPRIGPSLGTRGWPKALGAEYIARGPEPETR